MIIIIVTNMVSVFTYDAYQMTNLIIELSALVIDGNSEFPKMRI